MVQRGSGTVNRASTCGVPAVAVDCESCCHLQPGSGHSVWEYSQLVTDESRKVDNNNRCLKAKTTVLVLHDAQFLVD